VLLVLLDDISSSPERVLSAVYKLLGVDPIFISAKARDHINGASLPAFPALASFATKGADWLRAKRLYGLVELAKSLGGKRVYTGQDSFPTLAPETRRELIRRFVADIEYVEEAVGRELPEWRQ
jgi:hypothetical protein